METEKYENFPKYAVSYCAYGDASGLEEEDIKNINGWMEAENLDHLVDIEENGSFSNHPEFGLPCDVVTATFIKKPDEEFFESVYNEAQVLHNKN